jgi:hypothetical protein
VVGKALGRSVVTGHADRSQTWSDSLRRQHRGLDQLPGGGIRHEGPANQRRRMTEGDCGGGPGKLDGGSRRVSRGDHRSGGELGGGDRVATRPVTVTGESGDKDDGRRGRDQKAAEDPLGSAFRRPNSTPARGETPARVSGGSRGDEPSWRLISRRRNPECGLEG